MKGRDRSDAPFRSRGFGWRSDRERARAWEAAYLAAREAADATVLSVAARSPEPVGRLDGEASKVVADLAVARATGRYEEGDAVLEAVVSEEQLALEITGVQTDDLVLRLRQGNLTHIRRFDQQGRLVIDLVPGPWELRTARSTVRLGEHLLPIPTDLRAAFSTGRDGEDFLVGGIMTVVVEQSPTQTTVAASVEGGPGDHTVLLAEIGGELFLAPFVLTGGQAIARLTVDQGDVGLQEVRVAEEAIGVEVLDRAEPGSVLASVVASTTPGARAAWREIARTRGWSADSPYGAVLSELGRD